MSSAEMTSNKPYLIRAMYEWINDNDLTPYILVFADYPGLHVPEASIKDGQVVLNIAYRAVESLEISNTEITFQARFSGVSFPVYIPVSAVLAIYAQENGQGTMFNLETTESEAEAEESVDNKLKDEQTDTKKKKPSLRVIK